MPPVPTVNSAHPQDSSSRLRPGAARTGERKSDLVCRVKYCNTLPDIPFDLKFIDYPFPTNRYVQYKQTSLEKNYKYDILTEHDLGVNIDLIDPNVYTQGMTGYPQMSPGPVNLHPDDERLLEDDTHAPQAAKKSRHAHVNVSWLRRTEYISTELTRYQPQNNDKIEATVGFGGRRKAKMEEPSYADRESQLAAIEKTFESAKEPLMEHYSKPGVTAVEELPIFPDFDLWKYPCAQVIFDSDPAPVGRSVPAALEEMSQAMIRGVMDESGEQFVAYFLPTEDTLKKRKRDTDEGVDYKDEEEYDYLMAREYNWNVKNKASKGYEENYFFVVRNDAVYYNELETRVRLSKRRANQNKQRNRTRLVVTHRPLTAVEHRTHRHREAMLQPPTEEDEEDDEEMQEDIIEATGSGDEERNSRSRSRTRSRSYSRSRSGSPNASRSRSRSASESPRNSRSRSASGSRRDSRSRSDSRSPRRSRSDSESPRRSRSGSGSPRRSRSASGSPQRSRSGSGSPRRSRSGSLRSGSASSRHSRSRSGSASPRHSQSRSRSASRTPNLSRSGSRSRSSSRSRSKSPARSGGSSPGSNRTSHSDSE